jgi:RNA ligase (TIGR02306 family)
MAFFGITIEKIGRIWTHPKAEKLELASCEGLGFQFCVPKDQYTVGQEVVYFPIDTILPEEYKEKMGLRAPGRIKTIQLRGEYSQGFVYPLEKACEIFKQDLKSLPVEELTLFFRAEKYEPPLKFVSVGELLPLPEGQGIYDIENVDRYIDVWNELLTKDCVVLEKIEGTNISISKKDGELFVCQRANSIKEKDGINNAYWDVARKSKLLEKILKISDQDVVVMGEMIGPSIQNNIYKISEHKILVFDLRINGRWLNYESFKKICNELDIETVPEVAKGRLQDILKNKTAEEFADGFSLLFNTLREGIVIRPLVEEFHHTLRRVILKKHSLRYKSKEI